MHCELREEVWAAVEDQGLSPVNGHAVAHECRGQVRWTVHPRTTSPSLGSCFWIEEAGTLCRKRESWRSAVFDGGGRAADPWCLGPACEDCAFNLRGWGRSGQTARASYASSQRVEGSDCSCLSWQLSAFEALIRQAGRV